MAILDGCQEGKHTPMIQEIICPTCGEIIEVFTRDGKTVTDSECPVCKYLVKEGTSI